MDTLTTSAAAESQVFLIVLGGRTRRHWRVPVPIANKIVVAVATNLKRENQEEVKD